MFKLTTIILIALVIFLFYLNYKPKKPIEMFSSSPKPTSDIDCYPEYKSTYQLNVVDDKSGECIDSSNSPLTIDELSLAKGDNMSNLKWYQVSGRQQAEQICNFYDECQGFTFKGKNCNNGTSWSSDLWKNEENVGHCFARFLKNVSNIQPQKSCMYCYSKPSTDMINSINQNDNTNNNTNENNNSEENNNSNIETNNNVNQPNQANLSNDNNTIIEKSKNQNLDNTDTLKPNFNPLIQIPSKNINQVSPLLSNKDPNITGVSTSDFNYNSFGQFRDISNGNNDHNIINYNDFECSKKTSISVPKPKVYNTPNTGIDSNNGNFQLLDTDTQKKTLLDHQDVLFPNNQNYICIPQKNINILSNLGNNSYMTNLYNDDYNNKC